MAILKTDIKLNFDDISLVPARQSTINSRSDISVHYPLGELPFFVAPMDAVVDNKNYKQYTDLGFNVCLPRTDSNKEYFSNTAMIFNSYSLDEFKSKFITNIMEEINISPKYVLIDVANGHMKKLHDLCIQAKKLWGSHLKLMVGNIANPETYSLLCDIGVDYVRCSIGSGSACKTSSYTGIHYPMVSLIQECREIANKIENPTKIIADGGIKSFADAYKALACGADYVMMGSLFNKILTSSGDNYLFKRFKISQTLANKLYSLGFTIYKKYRGMSTFEVQTKWKKSKIRPEEGLVKFNKVEYTLEQFHNNITWYLKSQMSYLGCKYIEELVKGDIQIIQMTTSSLNRINKQGKIRNK